MCVCVRERGNNVCWRERERKGIGERINLFPTFSTFPQTPLHCAAEIGDVECANQLLQLGADVSAKDVRSERVCESATKTRGFV